MFYLSNAKYVGQGSISPPEGHNAFLIKPINPSACSSVQVVDKVLGTGNVESTSRFRSSHFLDQVIVRALQQSL